MTRIWLIRHGKPVDEVAGRCYGSLDVALSDTGRQQMAHVAEFLKTEPISAVYTSPLSRALESARVIASDFKVIPDFREMNFGELEGLTYDEIAVRYPDIYRDWTKVRFPGGESLADMRQRVLRAFDAICRDRENQTVAIASHGGVNRILIAWALQIPDSCIFRLAQDYAAVNLFTLTDGVPCVRSTNVNLSLL